MLLRFPPQINPPRGCAPSLSCLQDEVFPAMTEIDIRRNTIQIRSNRLVCATAVEPNAAAYLLADGAPAMPGGDNFVLCDTGGDDEPGCFFPDEGQANWIYGSGSGGLEVNSSSTCGSSGASCRAFADAFVMCWAHVVLICPSVHISKRPWRIGLRTLCDRRTTIRSEPFPFVVVVRTDVTLVGTARHFLRC